MQLIILSAFFVYSLAVNENTFSQNQRKSDKVVDDVIQAIPTSYEFKYSTGREGPAQLFREEHRDHDGSVRGKYGYVDPNGKLRIVEYTAGKNGFSASGDIGTDGVAQNEAQTAYRSDPSVRAQTDAWSRSRSNNLGQSANWNSPPLGWSSVDPLWNVGALPQHPGPQSQSISQTGRPIAQTPAINKDRVWDDRPQNRWDNRDRSLQKSQRRTDSIDWNTWDPSQQTWTKQNIQNTGARDWNSNVDHQWPRAQTDRGQNIPSYGQWAQQPTQAHAGNSWTPPSNGPTAGQWSHIPEKPTAGQWTQFRDNPIPDQWSQRQAPQKRIGAQQPTTTTQTDLFDLRQKWTGISNDGQQQRTSAQQPQLSPSAKRSQPTQTQWSQTQGKQDEWAQRGLAPPRGQGAYSWHKAIDHNTAPGQQQQQQQQQQPQQPQQEWPQSPARVGRLDDQNQPPIQPFPEQPSANWPVPNQHNQAQYAPQPVAQPVGGDIGSQWPSAPAGPSGDIFSGAPYVHFRIDHTVDANQPPLRYQYSY